MGVDGRPPWPLRRCYRPTWLTAFQLRRFFAIIDWRRPFVWQPASNLTNFRQIECGRIGAETKMAAGSCSATAATAATATTAAAAAYFSAILRLFISRLWLNDGGNNALEIWEQSVVCSKHLRNEDERLKKCLKKKKKKTRKYWWETGARARCLAPLFKKPSTVIENSTGISLVCALIARWNAHWLISLK